MIPQATRRHFAAVAWIGVLLTASAGDAHAYIDPGTGGMLLQLLLGGVAGALVVIKLYWGRLREAMAGLFGHKDKTEPPAAD